MTVCPHCFTDTQTLRSQSERIEALEQDLAEATRQLRPRVAVPKGFTKSETQIFALLLTRDVVYKNEIWDAIAHTKQDSDLKGLDVLICRFRKKLRDSFGIEIETIRSMGYRLPREHKDAVREKLAAA